MVWVDGGGDGGRGKRGVPAVERGAMEGSGRGIGHFEVENGVGEQGGPVKG